MLLDSSFACQFVNSSALAKPLLLETSLIVNFVNAVLWL